MYALRTYFSKGQTKARRTFLNIFRKFPKMSEDARRLPKTFEEDPQMFRWYTNEFRYNLRDKLDITEIINIFTCESFLSICYHSLYHWLLYNKKRFNAPTTTQGTSLVVAVRHNKWVITLRGWHIWIQNKFNLIQVLQPSSWFTCIYWTTGQSFSLEYNTTKPLLQRFRKPVVKMLSAFVGLVFVLFASLILDARGKVVFIHWMKYRSFIVSWLFPYVSYFVKDQLAIF